MNKYAALGLLIEAAKGRKVALIARTHPQARFAMYEFEVPLADGWRTHRTNGEERITTSAGGLLVFRSVSQSLRGETYDIIFLDVDVDRDMTTEDYDDLRHALRGKDSEIIRA